MGANHSATREPRRSTDGATWRRQPPKPRDPGCIRPLLDQDSRPGPQEGLLPRLGRASSASLVISSTLMPDILSEGAASEPAHEALWCRAPYSRATERKVGPHHNGSCLGLEAAVRQGQEALPRDGNDSALVASPIERHCEVDRCLARTDQDDVIAARERSEHPLGPWIPHLPPALKSHAVLDERMTRWEVAQCENSPVHDERFLGPPVKRQLFFPIRIDSAVLLPRAVRCLIRSSGMLPKTWRQTNAESQQTITKRAGGSPPRALQGRGQNGKESDTQGVHRRIRLPPQTCYPALERPDANGRSSGDRWQASLNPSSAGSILSTGGQPTSGLLPKHSRGPSPCLAAKCHHTCQQSLSKLTPRLQMRYYCNALRSV